MMTNTVSLCQILGGLRNRSFNTMKSHRKIIPTWLQGKKEVETEKSWKISSNKGTGGMEVCVVLFTPRTHVSHANSPLCQTRLIVVSCR